MKTKNFQIDCFEHFWNTIIADEVGKFVDMHPK